MCGYIDDSSGQLHWTSAQASLASTDPDTPYAPTTDHNIGTGNGWYAYLEPYSGVTQSYSRLVSPILSASPTTCKLNFSYYMYAEQGSEISFFVLLITQTSSTVLWSLGTSQGTTWNEQNINLGAVEYGHVIVFEALHDLNLGSVAVDDINFIDCTIISGTGTNCPFGEFSCTSGGCVTSEQVCDFENNCADGSDEDGCPSYQACSFDYTMCYWTNDDDNDFPMTRLPSSPSGPSSDHTGNNGYYLTVSASGSNTLQSSRLTGPVIGAEQGDACKIRLFKNIYQNDVGYINIYIRTWAGGLSLVKEISDIDYTLDWSRIDVPLNSAQYFEPVIEVVRSSGTSGSISIDDVSFSSNCHVDPYAALPCPSGQFSCNDGTCLSTNKMCNFQVDCVDGFDESTCPATCQFEEDDLCGWSNVDGNQLDWVEQQGLDGGSYGTPTSDTDNGAYGYYMTLKGSIINTKGRFTSASYSQNAATCEFEFYYYISGNNFGELNVYLASDDMIESNVFQATEATTQWTRGVIYLTSCLNNFRITFEGVVTANTQGSISIDDFKFNDCPSSERSTTCSSTEKKCASGHCVDQELWCDFSRDCCDGTDEDGFECASYSRCSFEKDYCDWYTTKSSAEWQLGQAPSGKPTTDHTTISTTGNYMYLDVFSMPSTTLAQLYSFAFAETSTDCSLRFYYYFNGAAAKMLNIYIISSDGTELKKSINSQVQAWTKSTVLLTPQTSTFQAILEGGLQDGQEGVIAIDDVSFSEGCIKSPTGVDNGDSTATTAPSDTTTPVAGGSGHVCDGTYSYKCYPDETLCYSSAQKCDFRNDCPSAYDEDECPSTYTFESAESVHYLWEEDITSQLDSFNWVREVANEAVTIYGPSTDHTKSTENGAYSYALLTFNTANSAAMLHGPTYSSSSSTCKFETWYYNSGQAVGNLDIVMVNEEGVVELMAVIYGDQGQSWKKITLDIGRQSKDFWIIITKVNDGTYDGRTAVDDLSFIDCANPLPATSCASDKFHCTTTKACISYKYVCDGVDSCGDNSDEEGCDRTLLQDFEQSSVKWIPDLSLNTGVMTWKKISGATPTAQTGPLRDHTKNSQNNYYMYIDASDGTAGSSAWLQGPIISPTDGVTGCKLRFWYYMIGRDVYRLSVYTRTYSNGGWSHLWDNIGETDDMTWYNAIIPLDGITSDFQVVFEAVVGNGEYGDISIDDVSFSLDCSLSTASTLPLDPIGGELPSEPAVPLECNSEEFQCRYSSSGVTCIAGNQECDFHKDCADSSDESDCVSDTCDFEDEELCGWLIVPSVNAPAPRSSRDSRASEPFEWRHGRGEEISQEELNARPTNDQSTGTSLGYYMYTDTSLADTGQTAELSTKNISNTGPQCVMQFYYWMTGDDVGSLHVFAHHQGDSIQQTPGDIVELWSRTGPQYIDWWFGEAFIGARTNFQIVFESRRGTQSTSDVAIDDVAFVNCEPPLPSSTLCNNQYTCANKICLDNSYVCDYGNDCGDNSDEVSLYCYSREPRCDFESGLCNFVREADSEITWQLKSPSSNAEGSLSPTTDHTTRSASGKYIFADPKTSTIGDNNGKARIGTPGLFSDRQESDGCKIRFFYNMPAEQGGVLKVYTRDQWNSDPNVGLTEMWSTTTAQPDSWLRAEVTVHSPNPFSVVIEAVHTSGNPSISIAIDDISFSDKCPYSAGGVQGTVPPATVPPPNGCSEGYLKCGNGACYEATQQCDFVDSCNDGDTNSFTPSSDEESCGSTCSFETSTCGWRDTQVSTGFNWSRKSSTGGSTNPTSSAGGTYYISVVTGSSSTSGSIAHLTSTVYRESMTTCKLQFSYNMNAEDSNIGTLSVLKKSSTGLTSTLFTNTGSTGDSWNLKTISIARELDFEIIFEAVNGLSSGFIAIDNIKFIDCGSTDGQSFCDASSFLCTDGSCVDYYEVCDAKYDCSDNTDEQTCTLQAADCDFDTNPIFTDGSTSTGCMYIQNKDDTAGRDWAAGYGGVVSGDYVSEGPDQDHTLGGGGSGRFLYVDMSTMFPGDITRFTTSTSFPQSYGVCKLTFWYYMTGTSVSTILKVFVVEIGGGRTLAASFVGSNHNWEYAAVDIGSNTDDYRVLFEAEAGTGVQIEGGVVALDDISFTDTCRSGSSPTGAPIVCNTNENSCRINGLDQCVPNTWWCDGLIDCDNGVDEVGCATQPTNTETTPLQTGCDDGQFACADSTCIPSLLRCDGVADCPSGGEDENSCSTNANCDEQTFYCPDVKACVSSNKLCDGVIDCPSNQVDESLCSGTCPIDYCGVGGKCELTSNNAPVCKCYDNYSGSRCQVYKFIEPIDTGLSGGAIAGIVIGAILLAVIIIYFLLAVMTKQSKSHSILSDSYRRNPDQSYNNPMYETTTGNDFSLQTFGSPTTPDAAKNSGFDNPLFGEDSRVHSKYGEGGETTA